MVSVLTDRGIGSTVARENDGSVQPRLGLIQLCGAKTSFIFELINIQISLFSKLIDSNSDLRFLKNKTESIQCCIDLQLNWSNTFNEQKYLASQVATQVVFDSLSLNKLLIVTTGRLLAT